MPRRRARRAAESAGLRVLQSPVSWWWGVGGMYGFEKLASGWSQTDSGTTSIGGRATSGRGWGGIEIPAKNITANRTVGSTTRQRFAVVGLIADWAFAALAAWFAAHSTPMQVLSAAAIAYGVRCALRKNNVTVDGAQHETTPRERRAAAAAVQCCGELCIHLRLHFTVGDTWLSGAARSTLCVEREPANPLEAARAQLDSRLLRRSAGDGCGYVVANAGHPTAVAAGAALPRFRFSLKVSGLITAGLVARARGFVDDERATRQLVDHAGCMFTSAAVRGTVRASLLHITVCIQLLYPAGGPAPQSWRHFTCDARPHWCVQLDDGDDRRCIDHGGMFATLLRRKAALPRCVAIGRRGGKMMDPLLSVVRAAQLRDLIENDATWEVAGQQMTPPEQRWLLLELYLRGRCIPPSLGS